MTPCPNKLLLFQFPQKVFGLLYAPPIFSQSQYYPYSHIRRYPNLSFPLGVNEISPILGRLGSRNKLCIVHGNRSVIAYLSPITVFAVHHLGYFFDTRNKVSKYTKDPHIPPAG